MEILSIERLTASVEPCLNFAVRITTDVDVALLAIGLNTSHEILFDISGEANKRDFTVEIPRYSYFRNFLVAEDISNIIPSNSDVVSLLGVSTWTIEQPFVTIAANGTATVIGEFGLPLQPSDSTMGNLLGITYSLDDVTFEGSNTFVGLAEGDYTMYQLDAFGCKKNIEFTVGELGDVEPYIELSLLNPLFFAKRNNLPRNPLNTLSYEQKTDLNFQDFQYQLYNETIYAFQFRSSYDVNQVELINCEGDVTILPITKKSENIRRTDIRDCVVQQLVAGINNVELFFEGGNVYDSDLNVIGVSTLNGTLLQDNTVNNFIEVIGEGVFQIIEVIDTIEGRRVVLNWESSFFTARAEIAKTVFNAFDYEIYEFTLPLGLNPDRYQIAIKANKILEALVLRYLSEQFQVLETKPQNSHFISWKNNENNQITWETGIQCNVYLPFVEPPTFAPESEDEVFMTDRAPRLLESKINELYTFYFGFLPLGVARQMQYIVSNSFLEIDGVNYTKQETPEIEAQNGSNNYLVRVNLMLADTFSSNERKDISDINTNVFGYLQIDTSGNLNLE